MPQTKIKKFLTKHKESLLHHLSEEQLIWVYNNIAKGATLSETAKRVIDDWMPQNKNRFKTLVTDMAAFKIDVLKPGEILKIQTEVKNDPEAAIIKKTMDEMSSKLDGMGRLGWLIDIQSNRVESLVKREAKALPMELTNNAVRQLGVLLEKYIEFQLESGHTFTMQEEPTQVDARVNALLEHTIKDSADDMAMAASRLIESAKQKAVNMDLDKSNQICISTLPAFETEQLALIPEESELKVEQG